MEGELNNLIEQNNLMDKKFEIKEEEEDDFQSSLDIKEFERKIKSKKEPKIIKDFVYNNSDSSDNDDSQRNNHKIHKGEALAFDPEAESKIQEITKEIVSKSNSNTKNPDKMSVEAVLQSKNESLKDKKIKELMQKNKALLVSFEREKSQKIKLEKELQQILKETEGNLEKIEGKAKKPMSETSGSLGPEDYKAKFQQADKKIQELRFEKQSLKNDLNKAMRIISREVGENINIDEILLQENSWKGRAQQIQILQTKVKELQAKLATMKQDSSSNVNTLYSEMNGSNYSQISSVSKSAEERRKEIESLKNQLQSTKNENDLLQSKIKALNSRKIILENEMKDIKTQYEENKKLLMEKSSNDDKYISALKSELEKSKQQINQLSSKAKDAATAEKQKSKPDNSIKLSPDYEKLKQEFLLLKDQMEQKEKIIKELINGKIRDSSSSGSLNDNAVKDLERDLTIAKKENEELVKNLVAGTDKDSEFTIKNLCNQNAQLRKKLYDLQQKLEVKAKK